jgi:uncharacterized protein (TIGR02996 family)
MQRELELLTQLAERPGDRSLRLVFSDWLSEQGDPRGEVIALGLQGGLSVTDRRRLERLTLKHGKAWLGPLAPLVDLSGCSWEAGFPVALKFKPGAPLAGVADDPRLATVRSLEFPPARELPSLGAFLHSRTLAGLERLVCPVPVLEWFGRTPWSFSPETLGASSFGTFDDEAVDLERLLGALAGLRRVRTLELETSEHLTRLVVHRLLRSVRDAGLLVRPFEALQLDARYAVIEGASEWLLQRQALSRHELPALGHWGAAVLELKLGLVRGEGGFDTLRVDLSGGGDSRGLEARLAAAASCLVLLAPCGPRTVQVLLPPGGRLRPSERDALRAAARRLRTVVSLEVDGEPVTP